jgi:hypothetical protein
MTPSFQVAFLSVLEPLCFSILALWLALRFWIEKDRAALAKELVIIAAAAWFCEATCVRLYGFYAYASVWRVFIDVVPLAVVCIWPVVIRSVLDLTRPLQARPLPRAALVTALVTVDAALIEPISVAAGLWWWTEPGPFLVPVIGVLGWGLFALGCALFMRDGRVHWHALVAAPLLTHGLLLAAWWGAFKWLPRMEPVLPWVIGAALGSLAVCALLLARGVRVPRRDVMLRAPAAMFFFVLLFVFAREQTMLVAFALAFAPPWLALLWRGR